MLQTSKMSSIPTRVTQHPQQDYGRHPPPSHARGPSKLQLMQLQMQQKYQQEKEQKMQEYGNQNQSNSYGVQDYHGDDSYSNQERGTVRKFFQERRETSDSNGYAQNINHHYKQVKQHQGNGFQPQSQVRNYGAAHDQRVTKYSGRPPLPMKQSAGRDKSNPLAPIDRTPKTTPHGSRQSSRRSSAQSGNSHASGFSGKPKITRHRKEEPVPYESDAENYQSNTEENGMSSSRSNSPKKKPTSFREWQEKQKRIRQASAGQTQFAHNPEQQFAEEENPTPNHKLSDFEKWQLEQDKQKQDRLQRHREQNGNVSNRSDRSSRVKSQSNVTNDDKAKQKKMLLQNRINSRKHVFPSPGRESYADDSGDDNNVDDEVAQKQRDLEEMIRRQQAELTRIQQETAAEQAKEQEERERRKRHAAEQKERQRKQREADERDRREREERERKIQQEMEEERLSRLKARESPKVQSSRYEYEESEDEQAVPFPRKAMKPPRSRQRNRAPPPAAQAKHTQPNLPPKQTYEPAINTNDDSVAFYLQAAAEASNEKLDLAPCKVCGRKFAKDRLQKHMAACKQSSKKKRKVFDPSKMRTEGTDAAKYQNKRKPEPKPKKNNWREQHDNFIKNIRYAKAVTDAEKGGGNMAALPPPPVAQNSDYEQCPHCQRKFNPSAAERHIPRCKTLKTRPPPIRR